MNLREFLETFATVEDLKDLLYSLDQPLTGRKAVLISRVLEAGGRSPLQIMVRLSNETLQDALRGNNLSPGGRKSELVVRLIKADVVSPSPDETLSFLESQDEEGFDSYCGLLLSAGVAMQAQRVALLLAKTSEGNLHMFAEAFRSGGDSAATAKALVSLLSEGSGHVPCFAACVLEDMMEAGGTVSPVASAIAGACDEIMARQRRIRESFDRFPQLAHPAVDALLQKCWSGDLAHESSILLLPRTLVRDPDRAILKQGPSRYG